MDKSAGGATGALARPSILEAGRGRPALHHQGWVEGDASSSLASAQRACSATTGSESSLSFFSAVTNFLLPLLPIAITAFRRRPESFGAPDGRSAKHFPELFLLHFGQPVERRIDQTFPRLELRRGSHWRLAIPRANVLTDVASENVPSHARAKLVWNLAPLLDGQIRDA